MAIGSLYAFARRKKRTSISEQKRRRMRKLTEDTLSRLQSLPTDKDYHAGYANLVDTARVPSSMSLKNGKSVLEPCSTSKENLKKQISEEIKEMSKSIKELTEAVKRQEEILQTIADQHEGKDEGAADYCNFECEEAIEDHDKSIIVKGFDKDMGRRRDVKKVLRNVFGSCGKIKSIFVPIACQTGVTLGYAFITFEDWQGGNEKALKMNGYLLVGRQLKVKLARGSGLLLGYSDSEVRWKRIQEAINTSPSAPLNGPHFKDADWSR